MHQDDRAEAGDLSAATCSAGRRQRAPDLVKRHDAASGKPESSPGKDERMLAVSAEPTSFWTLLMARMSFLMLHQDSSSGIFHRLEHYSLF